MNLQLRKPSKCYFVMLIWHIALLELEAKLNKGERNQPKPSAQSQVPSVAKVHADRAVLYVGGQIV